jgi:hypothetical protein
MVKFSEKLIFAFSISRQLQEKNKKYFPQMLFTKKSFIVHTDASNFGTITDSYRFGTTYKIPISMFVLELM